MADTQDSDGTVWMTERCVRSFHLYKETWEPVNGEMLECSCKPFISSVVSSMALAYSLYPKHPSPHC